MTLARADQILDWGDDSSPWTVIDQKSPGQMGLMLKRTSDFLKDWTIVWNKKFREC